MSKTPNKQSLLGKAPARKKTAQKRKPQRSTQRPSPAELNSSAKNDTSQKTTQKKPCRLYFNNVFHIVNLILS